MSRRHLLGRAASSGTRYRGSVFVASATCWKVGRFWNGNGGTVIALALVQRFMSKQIIATVLSYSAGRLAGNWTTCWKVGRLTHGMSGTAPTPTSL
jgi:hypothetical protein